MKKRQLSDVSKSNASGIECFMYSGIGVILTAMLILLIMVTGCRKDDALSLISGDENQSSSDISIISLSEVSGEFVYRAERLELPEELVSLSAFAITDDTLHIWEFVRTVLDKDWQLRNTHGLPTNRLAFDSRAREAMEMSYHGNAKAPTQAEMDQLLILIDSCSGIAGPGTLGIDENIWIIISEEASDYFSGACSAQEAVRIIQSRVSILVSERS